MDFLVIIFASAAAGALTLVSGFGLGTVLLVAFAFFFPLEVAIAGTGVVHLVNNLFKLVLVGRWANGAVVIRFGVPAMISAMVGAALMALMAVAPPLAEYRLGPHRAEVTWLKVVVAVLLGGLEGLELWPRYQSLSFPRSFLPIGGVMSGFFGGVSGMQGALRAPFLLRAGLTRDEFVGSANVISTMVDGARILVYLGAVPWLTSTRDYGLLTQEAQGRSGALIAAACVAACAGSLAGARSARKMTVRSVRIVVAILLFAAAAAMGAGIV